MKVSDDMTTYMNVLKPKLKGDTVCKHTLIFRRRWAEVLKDALSAWLFLLAGVGLNGADGNSQDAFQLTIAQANTENPRNSESDIIALNEGRLLLGWSEFYGKTSADDGSARIVGRVSEDGGRSWGKKYTLVEHEDGRNVMEVNFIRLKSGEIALFHFKKYEEVADTWNKSTSKTGDCRMIMRVSKDEGRSFGPPRELTQKNRYVESASGRGLMLKSGRIVIECDDYFGSAFCLISDDDGKTWHEGKRIKPVGGGCWEPAAIELKDGRLLMFLRTILGGQYQTISQDGGETWSVPTLTALRGSGSPIAIERIPRTGDLLAIWNHDVGSPHSRNPLTAAISTDDGQTWKHIQNIEDKSDDRWAYPAVTWVENRALITYFNYKGGMSLQLKSLPIDWFYQVRPRQ